MRKLLIYPQNVTINKLLIYPKKLTMHKLLIYPQNLTIHECRDVIERQYISLVRY